MYLVAECRERGNVYDYVVREIHRVRLHFQFVHTLQEVGARLNRGRNSFKGERNGDLNFLSLRHRIEVHMAWNVRKWVQVNFVDEGREGRSRPAESGERYDGRLARFAKYLSERERRDCNRRRRLVCAIADRRNEPRAPP